MSFRASTAAGQHTTILTTKTSHFSLQPIRLSVPPEPSQTFSRLLELWKLCANLLNRAARCNPQPIGMSVPSTKATRGKKENLTSGLLGGGARLKYGPTPAEHANIRHRERRVPLESTISCSLLRFCARLACSQRSCTCRFVVFLRDDCVFGVCCAASRRC